MRNELRAATALAADIELACWLNNTRDITHNAARLKRTLQSLNATCAIAHLTTLEQTTDPHHRDELAATLNQAVTALAVHA